MKSKSGENIGFNDEVIFLKRKIKLLNKEIKTDKEQIKTLKTKLKTAFDANPDSMNINRLADGMFVMVNKGFCSLFGFSRDEVIDKTTLELNIWAEPDQRSRFADIVNEKGNVTGFEARFRKKDGTLFTGIISAVKTDIDGVDHIINVARDISEQKNILEKMHNEQFLFNALMDNLSDAVYFKDRESRFIRISRSNLSKFGISDTSEAIGKTDFDFFTEEHAKQAFADEQEIISTSRSMSVEERETNIDRPDTWASTVKMPLKDYAGNIIGTFGISRDITDRKRIEFGNQVIYEITQALALTENLDDYLRLVHASLSKIVYAENCFIALYDEKTRLFSFPFFIDKFDTKPEPATLGKSCTAYVYRSGRPLLLTQEIFRLLAEKNEVELIGAESPSWLGIPLRNPSRISGVLVLQHYEKENVFSFEDVDFLISVCSQIATAIERKRSEDEIRSKNLELQNLNNEKDKFFSIVAHDLRGPLGSFVEAAKMLAEEYESLPSGQVMELVMLLKNGATSLYDLLDNLLQWARLRRGVMEFNPVELRLSEVIPVYLEPLMDLAGRKNISLILNIGNDHILKADENMLATILRNLVSNSIKFTQRGGIITIGSECIPGMMKVLIKDNGIGMDENLLARLFIISEKTNRPGTEGEPSSGLGLHLCKEFVEKHAGNINVLSEKGKGSVFVISIPLE